MILLIDNYDSFSYNLYQLIGSFQSDVMVIRNDELSLKEIQSLSLESIIISPGPGRPENAGICIDVIKTLSPKIPILGVCLGHQAICETFGGKVGYAPKLMHGKDSLITIDPKSCLFQGLPAQIQVARYHSLIAESKGLPDCLKVIAHTNDDEIMALAHKQYKTYGVQFHPESIMTPLGGKIIQNFLTSCKEHK